jgi:hypothetical protein
VVADWGPRRGGCALDGRRDVLVWDGSAGALDGGWEWFRLRTLRGAVDCAGAAPPECHDKEQRPDAERSGRAAVRYSQAVDLRNCRSHREDDEMAEVGKAIRRSLAGNHANGLRLA